MKKELIALCAVAAVVGVPCAMAETHSGTPTPHPTATHHAEPRGQLRSDTIGSDYETGLGYDTTTRRDFTAKKRDYEHEFSEPEDAAESLSGGYEGEAGAGVTNR